MHEPYSEVDYEEFFLQCGGHTKAVSVLGQVRTSLGHPEHGMDRPGK